MFLVPKGVAELHKLAGPEGSKIGGLRLERATDGTARAVVTDGACLVLVEWDDKDDRDTFPDVRIPSNPTHGFGVTIPTKIVKKALGQLDKDALPLLAVAEVIDDDKVGIATTDKHTTTRVEAKPITDPYVPYESIMPDGEARPVSRVILNFEKLARVAETLRSACGVTGDPHVRLEFFDDGTGKPIRVTIGTEDGPQAVGMLSPVGPGKGEKGKPAPTFDDLWKGLPPPLAPQATGPDPAQAQRIAELEAEVESLKGQRTTLVDGQIELANKATAQVNEAMEKLKAAEERAVAAELKAETTRKKLAALIEAFDGEPQAQAA